MKAPAFQFYADDFLGGTHDMTNEEVGAYIRLLCLQWTKGGIPSDPKRVALMAGGIAEPSLGYVLAKFQLCADGLLRNPRLEQVRCAQNEYHAKQSEKGRLGARKRWGNGTGNGTGIAGALAEGMPDTWPEGSSPSPSPSPLNTPYSPPADEPKATEPSKKDILKENAKRVIQVLNECTGSQFRCSDGNLKLITARLEEDGVDLDGVLKMVRRQSMVWGSDEKMAAYLRPETLFNKTKFESYYANREMPATNGPAVAAKASSEPRTFNDQMALFIRNKQLKANVQS